MTEFVVASLLGLGLGSWLIASGGLRGWLLGASLIGIGANYSALAVYAVELSRPDRLRAQILALGELPAAVRYYSVAQVRLMVPGLLAVLAVKSSQRRKL